MKEIVKQCQRKFSEWQEEHEMFNLQVYSSKLWEHSSLSLLLWWFHPIRVVVVSCVRCTRRTSWWTSCTRTTWRAPPSASSSACTPSPPAPPSSPSRRPPSRTGRPGPGSSATRSSSAASTSCSGPPWSSAWWIPVPGFRSCLCNLYFIGSDWVRQQMASCQYCWSNAGKCSGGYRNISVSNKHNKLSTSSTTLQRNVEIRILKLWHRHVKKQKYMFTSYNNLDSSV